MRFGTWKYSHLSTRDVESDGASDDDFVEGKADESLPHNERSTRRHGWQRTAIIVAGVAILTLTALYLLNILLLPGAWDDAARQECREPAIRKEWRTMPHEDKHAYISAVQCFMDLPSNVRDGTSAYDDLVLAHAQTGSYSHYAAAFLPWHRLFVHVFEETLQEKCGYEGAVPYWDWTKDYLDLSSAPVWDDHAGFGGNGVVSSDHDTSSSTRPDPSHLKCVQDGAFANTDRAWNGTSEGSSTHSVAYWPHCMERDFVGEAAGADAQRASEAARLGDAVSPSNVEATLAQPDYDSFFEAFETGAHNSIPQFVRGEWLSLTAPNDPVFFLHHAQVDRLWWLWQQRDPETRLREFHGPAQDFLTGHGGEGDASTSAEASATDMLPMAGLAPDRHVVDVMDTEGGFLCYVY
ncbi:hypothetical protein F5Y15DRAFT_220817 [Xylariaceae sp. FL0016]|nr:hypothetical protein F5Y15DRAFT_220817 [Xylariaceae sp. FL0016]